MNPFELHGPDFLLFYLVFGAFVLFGLIIWRRLAESGPIPKIDMSDSHLLANLRGGDQEMIKVAVVSLIDRNLLQVDSNGEVKTPGGGAVRAVRRPIERIILERFRQPGKATALFTDDQISAHASVVSDQLQRLQLIAIQRSTRAAIGECWSPSCSSAGSP